MKVSPSKRSLWVYIGLILMIGALILFSILPLATSIWQQSQSANVTPANPTDALTRRLETQGLGYQLVLEREPENVNAWQGLLETRLQQGDLTAAIAPLEKLAQLKPDKIEYSLLLAQAKQQLENYDGAEKIYRDLLQRNPFNIPVLKGLSDLFLAQNQPEKAISNLQQKISQAVQLKGTGQDENLNAQLTSLQLLLGEVYLQHKQDDQAIALYDTASQVNPTDFRPLLSKALVLQKQGKNDLASSLFQQ
ncbi:MAG: tetratricopeptide repeat protein, partial [Microcystaceae cyanobacterium]